jgi:hypothetical protein
MSDKKIVTPLKSRATKKISRKLPGKQQFEDGSWEGFLYQDPCLKKFGESASLGYGVERCLYELNPELACLSPCLIKARVISPHEALIALEEVANQPNRPAFPVDRHLAAFLMSRWKEMSFVLMRDLARSQRELKNLAALKILAGLQYQYKVSELPNLCQWMADLCLPIVTHYHSLKARAQLKEDIVKAVATGQLIKLLQLFENRQALMDDKCDFHAAKIEILLIESEIKEIETKIQNRNRAPFPAVKSIGSVVFSLLTAFKNALSSRRGEKRMKQLYHKSEILRETWGESLLPRSKPTKQDFWSKLWLKMNAK